MTRFCTKSARTIAEMGRESTAIGVDVRDWESVRSSAEEAQAWAGQIHIAVSVPGINRRKPVLELKPEEFSEIFDVNLKGVFHCAKAFGALMVPNGRGKIINMALSLWNVRRRTPRARGLWCS
jgi:3-oxoacyl-[acyl-carrier protein] reductase